MDPITTIQLSVLQVLCCNTAITHLRHLAKMAIIAWGWPAERVRIMDLDQGLSATNADGRGGFQELLAEVALDHIGLVLGFQMSRLSRRCVDWHQFL